MNNRFMRRIVPVALVLAVALPGLAYKFDFITVNDVVKKVRNRFRDMKGYQANFVITTVKSGKTSVQRGVLKYKNGNKMLVLFTSPHGQKIVSDGSRMWIYIPSMNVVAEQDLKSDGGLFDSTGSGLQRLFSKYHYRFDSKEQPQELNGKKYYTLFLKQKESRSGYRTMKLWVSEDFIITRAEGHTAAGKKVTIEFNNIKTDVSLPNSAFSFDIPSRARVIKNPMISEE